MKRLKYLAVICLAIALQIPLTAQAATEWLIEHVTGDLWRIQNDNNYFTLVLVTPEGLILTDPVNAKTATWIRDTVKEKFDLPIKYVIYSHSHGDHAPGAEMYEGATIVAHENAWPAIQAEKNNPALQPHLTFSDRMTLSLGGKQVSLIYLGLGHSDNLIAMHFLDERAVFSVDNLWINRVGYQTIRNSTVPEWFDGLKILEDIDFDILIPGHGHLGKTAGESVLGTKEDVTRFRNYFEALYDAVMDAKARGLSQQEAVAEIELPEYSHLGNYDLFFKMNVEGMYRQTPPDSAWYKCKKCGD